MRHFLAIVSSLLLFIGVNVTPVSAQSSADMNATLDELFGAHRPYHAFFDKLKTAVAADDKEAVASMVDYPFQARINGKAIIRSILFQTTTRSSRRRWTPLPSRLMRRCLPIGRA